MHEIKFSTIPEELNLIRKLRFYTFFSLAMLFPKGCSIGTVHASVKLIPEAFGSVFFVFLLPRALPVVKANAVPSVRVLLFKANYNVN